MPRIAWLVALVSLAAAPARADHLAATRAQPLVERSHTVEVTFADGIAIYTVRRVFENRGKVAEQVELELGLPYGAAATGLRIKARERWFDGELMERGQAAALYREMTGFGPHAPKDPALLAWMWADTLSLQVFPVLPGRSSTVEYTLTAPTRYENGRYFVGYPRTVAPPKAATGQATDETAGPPTLQLATPTIRVHAAWAVPGTVVMIDGHQVARDQPFALVPAPHQPWEDHIEEDPAASYVASTLSIPASSHTTKAFARATITLDLRHTYQSDLRVELLTPQGARVVVHYSTGSGTNDLRGTFPIELPAGTTAAGTWRLVVSDHVALDAGTLDRWSLSIGEGKDRTVAAATDTPMFIPDAPANATEGGVASISITPPPFTTWTGRFGHVEASADHVFSRLEVDVAPQLVATPKRAQVVFVVDTSYSMGAAGVQAQLDVLRAYLVHVPDAEVEIVTYQRFAHRAFGAFVPVKELPTALASALQRGAFALGNGSALDAGAQLAAQAVSFSAATAFGLAASNGTKLTIGL